MAEDTINAILGEFGKSIRLADVRLNEDKTCVLCADDDKKIQVSYNESNEALDFFASVGRITARGELCCDYLLKSNTVWELTKGAVLAKKNGSPDIILEYRLPLLNLTKELFARTFDQFVGLLADWKSYLPELCQGRIPKVFAGF